MLLKNFVSTLKAYMLNSTMLLSSKIFIKKYMYNQNDNFG